MYVSNDELKARLEAHGVERKGGAIIVNKYRGGRKAGSKNIPIDKKAEIGRDAKLLGSTVAAKIHGVTQPQASNLSRGVTTFENGVNPELKEKLEDKTDEARVAAVDNMMRALGLIGERLDSVKKATDLSLIATNMSRIIEKTGKKDSGGVRNNIVIYTPGIGKEDDYKVIEVAS